jgi:phytoene synthase
VTTHDTGSLERYIYGSAEVVGLMCLRCFLSDGLAGYPEMATAARRLGAAFQKVNFLRDLAADHTLLGRTYLPVPAGADFSDRDRDRVLDDIDVDLEVAATAIPLLPASSRRAVLAAYLLFSELTGRLRATPAERLLTERISVPPAVKIRILVRALLSGTSRCPR